MEKKKKNAEITYLVKTNSYLQHILSFYFRTNLVKCVNVNLHIAGYKI